MTEQEYSANNKIDWRWRENKMHPYEPLVISLAIAIPLYFCIAGSYKIHKAHQQELQNAPSNLEMCIGCHTK